MRKGKAARHDGSGTIPGENETMTKEKAKPGRSTELRRLAEEALRESEERFRFLSEATFEGIVVHEEGRVVKGNDQFFEMFGYETGELVGEQVVPLIIAPESVNLVKEQIRSKTAAHYEAIGVRKDGTSFPIEIHGKSMTYKGRPVRVGAIRDISERKRAEEALKESARLNQLLLDTLPHPAMLIGRDRIVMAANRTAREAGTEVGDYCWSTFGREQYISNDDKQRIKKRRGKTPIEGIKCSFCMADEAFDKNESINNSELEAFGQLWDTWWVPIDDKVYLHYAINITERKELEERLRESHDELERRVEERTEEVIVANELLRREIEVRKRSEEALRESQARYRELWDATPVAYHTLDASGIITHVNQTEANMLGYKKEEMVGKPIFEFIAPEQRDDAEERFQRKLSGKPIHKYEDRMYVRKDGTRIYVSIDDAFEYDGNGHVASVRTTMVDITQRKKAEVKLRRSNRAMKVLSDSNEALVHATNESELVDEVCRIIVDDGGYRLAWVGLAEQDASKTVRPVAQRGFEDGYLKTLDITWSDTERGRGPTGMAIRTKKPALARNIMTDPSFAPWREAAAERGYKSSISLPLIFEGRSFGALNIYAGEPDAFDQEETHLLSNLSDDLSYGIMALRAREELRRLSARLIEVQEHERKRISMELHDSVGQSLAAIKFAVESALDKMRGPQAEEGMQI